MQTTTPSMSSRSSDMRRWKCSGAEVMPKSILWKQNLPNGVMKVISGLNLEIGVFAKTLNWHLIYLAPASWGRI